MHKIKSKNKALQPNKKYRHLSHQWYPKIIRGKETQFKVDKLGNKISAKKIDTYNDDVYVSDAANIKPRALHTIINKSRKALKEYGISDNKMPTIVILNEKELPEAFGKYDVTINTVFYIQEIADKKIMGNNFGTIEYHEMWHFKQANDFIKNGWKITKENRNKYIIELCKKCKKKIDEFGIDEYNVGEISEYAYEMYLDGRYDEVEAEYIAKRRKGGKYD